MAGVNELFCDECVYFPKVKKRRSFPFGFLCANIGLACLLKGNVVMIPYLCSRASSPRMTSLRLFSAGRL